MITIVDLMKLNVKELKDLITMAQDVRQLKGKNAVKDMTIGTEFQITGDKNLNKIFILNKVNRTKVVAEDKESGLSYTIPFGMVIVD